MLYYVVEDKEYQEKAEKLISGANIRTSNSEEAVKVNEKLGEIIKQIETTDSGSFLLHKDNFEEMLQEIKVTTCFHE